MPLTAQDRLLGLIPESEGFKRVSFFLDAEQTLTFPRVKTIGYKSKNFWWSFKPEKEPKTL
jgi:hypothetical protein